MSPRSVLPQMPGCPIHRVVLRWVGCNQPTSHTVVAVASSAHGKESSFRPKRSAVEKSAFLPQPPTCKTFLIRFAMTDDDHHDTGHHNTPRSPYLHRRPPRPHPPPHHPRQHPRTLPPP